MRLLLKNIGIGFVLIGVLLLAIPYFTQLQTNASLLAGGALILGGFVAYMLINKYIQ
jgi:drug/metabolite transporter (DMT)-like permease